MNTTLWICQILLALAFSTAGTMKLFQPKTKLREVMPFTDELEERTVRLIGFLEVLGAMGVVLPWLLGIGTWLTPLAALGLALTMAAAMVVHGRRKEPTQLSVNAVLLLISLFIAFGRYTPAFA